MEWSALPFLLALTIQTVSSSAPVIHAPWGALRGISMEGDTGRKMNAYMGIPYAVPPVGEMRFEKPEPHPGLEKGEVFDADKIMPPCPQRPVLIGSARNTSEDCLMLDVYMPAEDDPSTPKPYAVMVFIHGGGFTMGDAYLYRPSKLVVDGQVVVVVIQYRLGLFGFLSSGDDAIPENLGLWDQNLALRWVQQNIATFGGDPDQITIFGESAGSISVGFHLIIPRSKGLFKRAIMQSGSPQQFVHVINVFDKKTVFRGFTDLVGCEGESSQQLVQCLKKLPVEYLMNRSMEYEMASPVMNYYFPVVDGELVPRDPRDLLQDPDFIQKNGLEDIDIILGFNKHEGALVLMYQVFLQLPEETLHSADFFGGIRDQCFLITRLSNNTALKKVTEFFYRRAEFTQNVSQSLDPVVDLYGDCLMNVFIVEWARYLAAASRSGALHMYVIDHDFDFNNQGPLPGAHHGDELALLFDLEREIPDDFILKIMNKLTIAEGEHPLSQKLIDMWTMFAKTGNPSTPIRDDLGGDWPQFTTEEEEYLSISQSPRVVPKMGPYRDRVAFWLHLLPELDSLISKPAAEEEATKEPPSPREEL